MKLEEKYKKELDAYNKVLLLNEDINDKTISKWLDNVTYLAKKIKRGFRKDSWDQLDEMFDTLEYQVKNIISDYNIWKNNLKK